MSKIKVTEIAPSSSNTTSITLGTNSNVTFANGVTATSFTGDGANLTNVPAPSTFDAANLTGTLPAIDGSALTGIAAGGGGYEFIKKVTINDSSNQVASVSETGLNYDSIYRVVWLTLSFNLDATPSIYPHMDNSTSIITSGSLQSWETCTQCHQNYGGTSQFTGDNYWKFEGGSYNGTYWGGFFDFSTSYQPWCIGAMSNKKDYGFCHLYGTKGFQGNTNNDPNQTISQAKMNGFTFKDSSPGWQIQNGSTYILYKWKDS